MRNKVVTNLRQWEQFCNSLTFVKAEYLGFGLQLKVLGVKVLPLLNLCFVVRDPPCNDDVVAGFRRGAFFKRQRKGQQPRCYAKTHFSLSTPLVHF